MASSTGVGACGAGASSLQVGDVGCKHCEFEGSASTGRIVIYHNHDEKSSRTVTHRADELRLTNFQHKLTNRLSHSTLSFWRVPNRV